MNESKILSLIATQLRKSSKMHEVISDNIARSKIPHEKAKTLDLKKFDAVFSQFNRKVQLSTTDSKHIGFNNNLPNNYKVINDSTAKNYNLNGNNIVVEEQMAEMNKHANNLKSNLKAYTKLMEILNKSVSWS